MRELLPVIDMTLESYCKGSVCFNWLETNHVWSLHCTEFLVVIFRIQLLSTSDVFVPTLVITQNNFTINM